MDEETRAYLQALEARLVAGQDRLMERLNTQSERLLNRVEGLERSFESARGFLLEDAVSAGRRWLDLEARVSEIERRLGPL